MLTALFRRVDADGDGGLSLAEFRSMSKLTGLSRRNLARLFAAVDTDGDGEVTCDEFIEEMLAFYNEHMKTVRSARRHPPPHERA